MALAMLLTGVAAGVLYDVLSLAKRGRGRAAAVCIDILIFVLTGFMASAVAICFYQGRMRYYHLGAMLAGGFLYFFLPRAAVKRLFKALKEKRKTRFRGE